MKPKIITEGMAKIAIEKDVFYNTHMKMCRNISSLWVGSLPLINICIDAFCASGIRGIRYKLENKNVVKVVFVDRSEKAEKSTKKNVGLNKLKKADFAIFNSDVRKYLLENPEFDLVEIDPFGTPVPYLDSIFYADGRRKEEYISITATDTAVLCGAHAKACINGYGAKPLDNEFCHENALRILMGRIAIIGAQYDWALEPQFCFSHRHYVKVLAKIVKSSEEARKSALMAMKYVEYCPHCLFHSIADGFPREKCPNCGKKMDYAGPLWGGKWAEKESVEKMMKLLAERKYLKGDAKKGEGGKKKDGAVNDLRELSNFLQKVAEECQGPALYYDLHEIASKYKCKIPPSEEIILKLRKAGYFASRTHFSEKGIRTDAGIKEILEKIRQ